jgi:hypothetical protein
LKTRLMLWIRDKHYLRVTKTSKLLQTSMHVYRWKTHINDPEILFARLQDIVAPSLSSFPPSDDNASSDQLSDVPVFVTSLVTNLPDLTQDHIRDVHIEDNDTETQPTNPTLDVPIQRPEPNPRPVRDLMPLSC